MWKKIFVLLLLVHLTGCDQNILHADDLKMAQEAYNERNMPLCERLLGRYLQVQQDSDKRWNAWELLLKAINSNGQQPRASIECLEAMLVEYEDDGQKLAEILKNLGKYNEVLRRYDKAGDAWTAYTELAEISEKERVEGLRRLAAMQFSQRHFDAGEETLQQCLALPAPDHDKIYCMLDLADVNVARERWQEAADLCQQILDSEPDEKISGLAGYLMGDSLEQMERYGDALEHFEKARKNYPNPAVMDSRITHLKKIISARK